MDLYINLYLCILLTSYMVYSHCSSVQFTIKAFYMKSAKNRKFVTTCFSLDTLSYYFSGMCYRM